MRHVSRTHRVALDWLFDRTKLEPMIEVEYVDTKNQLADATPSPNGRERTIYGMISRGQSRFVDEVNAELGSSAELLSELQKAQGKEPCMAQSKTSIQETGAAHVTSQTTIKEICADTLSVFPGQASLFTQRTIPTNEKKWQAIPVNSSYGRALSIAVSKVVTRMVRPYDQDGGEDKMPHCFVGTP